VTDLVTGEAVVLELRLAKLASRLLSLLIDLIVQGVLLVVGLLVIGGVAGSADDAAAAAIVLVFLVLVIVGYPVAFETLTRGRTLGKMALGLRVVRDDGGPIRFRHALVRAMAAVIEIWITAGAVALVVSLASSQGKRLGDFLAGTVVVRERVPTSSAAVVTMPPQLAWWASGLDLSRLPDDLALAARQFLSRSRELAPEIRDSMGARLAASVAACTSPPAPAGVPAWAFLSAVLAERRRRETVRLGASSAAPPAPYAQPLPYGQPAPPPPYGQPAPPPPYAQPSPYGQPAPPPPYGQPAPPPPYAQPSPYGQPAPPPPYGQPAPPPPYDAAPQWPVQAAPQPPASAPPPSAAPPPDDENPFAPPQ
jgi:uncharacterized RDD family membrane protein YckC